VQGRREKRDAEQRDADALKDAQWAGLESEVRL
jgi:hypothetical protein